MTPRAAGRGTPPRWHRPDVERVHETEGHVAWLHLPGHVPHEEAVALFWAHLIEWEEPAVLGRGGPFHTWLRKTPSRGEWGGMNYNYCGPGRGATKVTVAHVGAMARPPRRCLGRPHCWNPGVTGVTFERPERTTVWLCRGHQSVLPLVQRAMWVGMTAAEATEALHRGHLHRADLDTMLALQQD